MIIKRYIVDSMNEAMVKIRYELGSDAVIVSQRKIKQKGPFGIFKSRKMEVTAAVDEKSKKKQNMEEENKVIQNELLELKNLLKNAIVQNNTTNSSSMPKKDNKIKFKMDLLDKDIPEEIVDDIYNTIRENNSDKKLNASIYKKEFKNIISETIKVANTSNSRIHVLVGPTGVGKTTTIAKLASLFTLYKNKKVGLITLDTYRIGAVEQLKTYADILGVPFEVVISLKDISNSIKKMENCDVIFIDTTGRNSKNAMQISEIRSFVNEINPDIVHLVLSMTTKQKDLKRIIQDYKLVNYDSLILTKLDETDVYGSILTASYFSNVPISYISSGQNVPDDIDEGDINIISKLIIGAEN